jgi:hypothetical protein
LDEQQQTVRNSKKRAPLLAGNMSGKNLQNQAVTPHKHLKPELNIREMNATL